MKRFAHTRQCQQERMSRQGSAFAGKGSPGSKNVVVARLVCAALSIGAARAWADDTPQPPAPDSANLAPATPSLMPALSGPLVANPKPVSYEAGPLGKVYVTGIVSGFGQWQSNVVPGDYGGQRDLSNAQVFLNKPDGLVQFFVELGAYSLSDLGVPYLRSNTATSAFYGPFSQGYIKLAPNDSFSIEVGKLPTLIGAEYTFSFENMNIQRGLLWNQENAVNRGVQVNYAKGPLTLAASWNDGLYSNHWSWAWLSAAWTFNKANTLALIGSGNTTRTNISTTATPLFLNNEQLYNLIYTHTAGQWTFQPYLQYTHVPQTPEIGATQDASTYGAALLMNYAFPSDAQIGGLKMAGVSLPVRFEYIASSGNAANGAPNLMYGPGSKAWSVTFTPTYQYKLLFVRGELSYVKASSTTPGYALGADFNKTSQARALVEAGVLF